MNKQTQIFGIEATFDELAERIRGFSHDDASVTEQGKMVAACKDLAEETVRRWQELNAEARVELDGAPAPDAPAPEITG